MLGVEIISTLLLFDMSICMFLFEHNFEVDPHIWKVQILVLAVASDASKNEMDISVNSNKQN
jgi:hypothetical protein